MNNPIILKVEVGIANEHCIYRYESHCCQRLLAEYNVIKNWLQDERIKNKFVFIIINWMEKW